MFKTWSLSRHWHPLDGKVKHSSSFTDFEMLWQTSQQTRRNYWDRNFVCNLINLVHFIFVFTSAFKVKVYQGITLVKCNIKYCKMLNCSQGAERVNKLLIPIDLLSRNTSDTGENRHSVISPEHTHNERTGLWPLNIL